MRGGSATVIILLVVLIVIIGAVAYVLFATKPQTQVSQVPAVATSSPTAPSSPAASAALNCGTVSDKDTATTNGNATWPPQDATVWGCMTKALSDCSQATMTELGSSGTSYYKITGENGANCTMDYMSAPLEQAFPSRSMQCALALSTIAQAQSSIDPANPGNFFESMVLDFGLTVGSLNNIGDVAQPNPAITCSRINNW